MGERIDGGVGKEKEESRVVALGISGERGEEGRTREYWSDKIAKPVFRSLVSFSSWLR